MAYRCTKGCDRELKTLGGWKRHMTVEHNGYFPSDLEEITGGGEGIHLSGAGSLSEYTSNMPEDAASLSDEFDAEQQPQPRLVRSNGGDVEQPTIITPSTVEMRKAARKMKVRMDKMMDRFATDVPNGLAKGLGVTLDDDDRGIIKEAFEMVFEILDINFEVAPIGFTVRNRLLVLMYPVAVLGMIFGIKKVQVMQKNLENEENKKAEGL